MAYNTKTKFENCSYEAYYDEIRLASSQVVFIISSDKFATIQSSKDKIRELKATIHKRIQEDIRIIRAICPQKSGMKCLKKAK